MGLRAQHYPVILAEWPPVDWFEAVSENYMDTGGRPVQILEKIRSRYPVALHGTALSIGSTDPLNEKYLGRLRALADRIEPFIVSDHLCWSGAGGEQLHDLLPLPYTEEAVRHVVGRVQRVQETLGRRILLENVSTYVAYRHSVMSEWEFLTEVARRSGCGILLDINNIYVNSFNHGFDPHEYLKGVPGKYVGQIHLAGHADKGKYLFDTHGAPVRERVWNLYREALGWWGRISTLIEWDEDIPDFERVWQECRKAKAICDASAAAAPDRAAWNGPEPRAEFPPSVITLHEVQDEFRSAIDSLRRGGATIPDGLLFRQQGGEAGEKRVAIYANGYQARIREALAEVFEAVEAAVGHEAFDGRAILYAARHGDEDYNLNHCGAHFADFLSGLETAARHPFLPDLARLEWDIWQAFHAFDGKPADASGLAAVPPGSWENARLVFQPSVRLRSSEWPVLDMWLARKKPETAPVIERREQRILVGRRGEQVRCELLGPEQHRLIAGLLAGKTLGEACAALAAEAVGSEFPIGSWFAGWAKDGLISRCEFSSPVAS